MFLGQFVSLIARERIPAKKAIESARKLEFWHVIEDHYLAKGWTRRDLERQSACMACKRSTVRSRLAPPNCREYAVGFADSYEGFVPFV